MPQDVRTWEIKNGNIHGLKKYQLDVEERIADWIAEDISFLSYGLLIIGGQVATVAGGIIDRAIHELNWYITFLMVHMPDTTICTSSRNVQVKQSC